MPGSPDPQEERLRERGGKPARALISRAKPGKATKPSDPGQPVEVIWKLTLRVLPEDRAPFDAVIQVPYPQKAGGPPVGSMIGVLYDPHHQDDVALDRTASTESWGSVQATVMSHLVPPGATTARGPLVIAGGQVIQPPAADRPPSLAEQLEQLADLKTRGVLTESEFQAEKQKLLGT
jgi:hypothetical protein